MTIANMDSIYVTHGDWQVECLPTDGARLRRLCYAGRQLLTDPPCHFQPPTHDLGRYEQRPVYGYDDCFPTVDPCQAEWDQTLHLPDHGDLCYQAWKVQTGPGQLTCSVQSRLTQMSFRRQMLFEGDRLTWRFETRNTSAAVRTVMHVMHPLMPIGAVTNVRLPHYRELFDDVGKRCIAGMSSHQLADLLLEPRPTTRMLMLRQVLDGRFAIEFDGKMWLDVEFDAKEFHTLGLWWNRGGYPDKAKRSRSECAIEQMPGIHGSVARSAQAGTAWRLSPGEVKRWQVVWRLWENGRPRH